MATANQCVIIYCLVYSQSLHTDMRYIVAMQQTAKNESSGLAFRSIESIFIDECDLERMRARCQLPLPSQD